MAMSDRERIGRDQIIKYLGRQGYKTYGDLLSRYHLNLTRDPNVLGYMEPDKGRIVVNSSLDMEQISVVIRHEILHFYLDHTKRIFNKLALEKKLDPNNLSKESIEEITKEAFTQIANIAMDYDISNQAYTDKDKAIIRTMHALVTEDDHADWVDLTMEEMYDKLRQEEQAKPKIVYGALVNSTTFVGSDGRVYGK